MARLLTLLSTALLVQANSDDWCGYGFNKCQGLSNGLNNLACGFCRVWPLSSSIADNVLRVKRMDGNALPGDSSSNAYVAELSLDQAFTTSDGSAWTLNKIPTTVPPTIDGGFWASQDNATIYAYGGRAPDASLAVNDSTALPQLDVGSETWSTPSGNPLSVTRLTAGVDVNVPGSQVAYYLGGYQSEDTTAQIKDNNIHFATQMIKFNTTTGSASTLPAPNILPVQYGALTWLPYGSDGILVYFGGEKPSQQSVVNCTGCSVTSWDHVWIYDIGGQAWHQQPTKNSVDPRSEFCTATLYDQESNSWQIWTMGGRAFADTDAMNDVSILSIPSFQWFNAKPGNDRMSTTCQAVGPQIFVIGGRTQNTPVGGSNYGQLAYIYDANQQQIVSSYSPTSTSYLAPSSIRAAISIASTPTSWGDASIKALFATSTSITTPTLAAASATSSNGSTDAPQGSSLSVGAIVGIVVGAVTVLALVILLVWFLLRRRKRAQEQDQHQGIQYAEVDSAYARQEVYAKERVEVEVSPQRQEMPDHARVELDAKREASEAPGWSTDYELPAK